MRLRILSAVEFLTLLIVLQLGVASQVFAIAVPVGNPSFETPVLPPNSGSGSPAPWIGPVGGNGGAGHFRSGSALYPNQDGNQMAYLLVRNVPGSFGALFQDVTPIQAGTYALTAAVAKEAFVPPTTVPFTLNLEAFDGSSSTVLAGNNFPVSTFNTTTMTDVTTSVTIPVGSPNIGRMLRILLAVQGMDAGGNPQDPRATYNADNVRLSFTPVPEPGSMALLAVGCAAFGLHRGRRSK